MKNIRHDRYGTQAYFKHAGKFLSQRWAIRDVPKKDDRERKAREWLANARASVQLKQPLPESTGPTFEDDAVTYLDAVTSLASYADRVRHITAWAAAFKGRSRNTIAPLEIRTQLERWRTTLSANTCNNIRTALMSFYTRLNGKSGYNPVRDVERYRDEPEPRAQRPITIYRILALMGRSRTRARLRVILATGWPHAQIERLQPAHLDLTHARAYVTPRRKGKGRKGVWLPLLPEAVAALTEFVQLDCFTKKGQPAFSRGSMRKSFRVALAKLNARRTVYGHLPLEMRVYDLRHTFGTALAHRITDERALQELMMHSTTEQTRRYTEAATQGRVERALANFVASSSNPSNTSRQTRQNRAYSIGARTAKARVVS